jgi:Xaa-Pro aminopeptidase
MSSSSNSALLLFGETYHHPNLLYKTGFLAPDPVIYLEQDGRASLYTNFMEFERARKESRVGDIHHFEEFGFMEKASKTSNSTEAFAILLPDIMQRAGVTAVLVEPEFPLLLADRLRAAGVEVSSAPELFALVRRQKRPDEVEKIAAVELAGLEGLKAAVALIASSQVGADGVLHARGSPLTSERLIAAIEARLLELGCTTEDTIACGGPASADPHARSSGLLRAGEPIVLDIYPLHKGHRYWGDLTRTVIKGTPQPGIERMYDAVLGAQEEGVRRIRAGANGRDLHRALCEVLHRAGYSSLHPDFATPASAARFIHGTGHGLGLEVHEPPRIGNVDMTLLEGDVVTVEPGLYDPAIGGVRIEDLVVVTKDGCRNLTPYPKTWRVERLPV